jgi:hypothetical protein
MVMTEKDQNETVILNEDDPVASAEQVADGKVDQEAYFKAVERRAKRLVSTEARRVRWRRRSVSRSA